MTGGYVHAGYHEVMYTDATKNTLDAVKKEAEESGDERILWRVSSTLFSHMRYDVDLSPLEELKHLYNEEEAKKKYPVMTAHEKVIQELKAINLVPKQSYADK
jgi:hypothetical protein